MTCLAPNTRFPSISAHILRGLSLCALLASVGCSGDAASAVTDALAGDSSIVNTAIDGGYPSVGDGSTVDSGSLGGYDGGVTYPSVDSSVTPPVGSGASDAGTATDSGSTADAGTDSGSGLPDLGSLFPPAPDAGTSSTPDASTPSTGGATDKSAPCKDLNLFCIDPFDMFIFNPDLCFTCNGGKGCQGCATPYAY